MPAEHETTREVFLRVLYDTDEIPNDAELLASMIAVPAEIHVLPAPPPGASSPEGGLEAGGLVPPGEREALARRLEQAQTNLVVEFGMGATSSLVCKQLQPIIDDLRTDESGANDA